MVLYDKVQKYIAFLEAQLPITSYSIRKKEFHSWVVREESHLHAIQVSKSNTRYKKIKDMQDKIDALTKTTLEQSNEILRLKYENLVMQKSLGIQKIVNVWETLPMPTDTNEETDSFPE